MTVRTPRRRLNRLLPLKFPDIILILSARSELFDSAEAAPIVGQFVTTSMSLTGRNFPRPSRIKVNSIGLLATIVTFSYFLTYAVLKKNNHIRFYVIEPPTHGFSDVWSITEPG